MDRKNHVCLCNEDFPDYPKYSGCYAIVYVSGLFATEEKISILAVAMGDDGNDKFIEVKSDKLMKAMFGENYPKIKGIINLIIGSLVSFSTDQSLAGVEIDINNWVPPLSGVSYIASRSCSCDIYGLLKQAISMGCLVSDVFIEEDHEAENQRLRGE